MPHPRKNLKLTGDTHPPEVEDDLGEEDAEQALQPAPAVAASAAAPEPAPRREAAARTTALRLSAPVERYLDAARAQVRERPFAALASAFAAGLVLAVFTRSDR